MEEQQIQPQKQHPLIGVLTRQREEALNQAANAEAAALTWMERAQVAEAKLAEHDVPEAEVVPKKAAAK